MSDPKYRITEHHLDTKHGIARLERDGFSRETIMKSMYNLTPGVDQRERTKIVKELFNRKGEC
jgi:hypothetical protein